MNTSCRGATSIGEHKAGSSHAQDNDAVNCSIAERINKIVNGALFIFDIIQGTMMMPVIHEFELDDSIKHYILD
jgi:hypothetical protein